MRLIDADKLRLVKCGEFDSGKPINCVYEWAIKDAPTVKAIPIEWIEKKLNCCDNINAEIFVKSLIRDWRKENDRS